MAGYPRINGKQLGDKAKRPKPGIPLIKNQVEEGITFFKGNISRIADHLGTTRTTIRNFINRDPELVEALADSRERWLDNLEHCVWTRAEESNDTALQLFLLKTQGRSRGYEQDEVKNAAKDIATAAFDFIVNKSKNPAEQDKSKS